MPRNVLQYCYTSSHVKLGWKRTSEEKKQQNGEGKSQRKGQQGPLPQGIRIVGAHSQAGSAYHEHFKLVTFENR